MAQASPCFDAPQSEPPQLAKLQKLSLDDKILYSSVKIKEFYIATKGKVYVAYSGGKDSTVLLHLVRSIYPDVPAVFVDTGLEFPEIRDHVKQTENVVWVKPEMSFRQVIKEKGYPVVSKSISHWVDLAKRGQPSGIKQMSSDSRFGGKRYEYLIDAPFKISRDCCDILKKKPSKKYHQETGLCPYIGMLAEESDTRRQAYGMHGENNTDRAIPTSNPLMIWTTKDIWEYIKRYDLPYASIYDKGYPRTGCIFCMFGITVDRDRILRDLGTLPYIMVNRDAPRTQRMTDLKRWTRPQIFFTTDYEDYVRSNHARMTDSMVIQRQATLDRLETYSKPLKGVDIE